jgi:hypothetical protein
MIILFALSVAAAITPAQTTALRCVAGLAIVADQQRRGEGWKDYPDLNKDGPDFAALVGEDVMEATGKTQEQVRDLIFAEVEKIKKQAKIDRGEIDKCAAIMAASLPLHQGGSS